jgi:hypothetical protein
MKLLINNTEIQEICYDSMFVTEDNIEMIKIFLNENDFYFILISESDNFSIIEVQELPVDYYYNVFYNNQNEPIELYKYIYDGEFIKIYTNTLI